MVEYKCDKCNKIFDKKSNYVVHINKKYSCNKDIQLTPINTDAAPNDSDIAENIICNYCKKTFSRQSSLIRHINDRCKVKKDDTNKKEDIYQKLLNEINILKNENLQQKKEFTQQINDLKQK